MSGWAIASIAFGGVCGVAAVVFLIIDLLKYKTTTGTIIGNESYTGETIEMYAPTIRFRTEDGVDRTFQSICYFSGEPYPEGQDIPVRYHPTIARLNGVNKIVHRWFGVLIFGFFAIAFVWLGFEI